MFSRISLAVFLSLCIVVSVQAQNEVEKTPTLQDAKTIADVSAYLRNELDKIDRDGGAQGSNAKYADTYWSAGEKVLEIAQDDMEKGSGYNMKLRAFEYQILGRVDGAEQRREAFLNEIAAHESAVIRGLASSYRFRQFRSRAMDAEVSLECFDQFKSELKTWINQKDLAVSNITSLGLDIASRNKVPAEQFVKEMIGYVQSSECTLTTEEKAKRISSLEGVLRLTVGNDPKLYGKTLDNKDFKWDDLRKKYVLIKFTATWCGPCQMQIPGMIEEYEKYKDKGLEIISVYMWQRESDPVAAVKKYVEDKKLPWVIISEELSKRAKHPEFGEYYAVRGVPTFVLVDKEGKIIMPASHGVEWKAKLAEIFK
jgi:thiol-disulfide isomerase/thioredoxin